LGVQVSSRPLTVFALQNGYEIKAKDSETIWMACLIVVRVECKGSIPGLISGWTSFNSAHAHLKRFNYSGWAVALLTQTDKIEFNLLESKVVGSNVVVFRLSDDTLVKVYVDVDKAGVATTYRNPDGTPHYMVNTTVKLTIVPKDRKFTIPASDVIKAPQEKQPPSHVM
jgi:hypothetical protein